jgi:protein SCO1/2
MKRSLLAALLVLVATAAYAAPLPGDSVLQSPGTFTDQSGNGFQLADRRGHVQLISMFYASCTYTCPLTIDAGKGIEHALTPAQRDAVRLLMVSFDTQRDTPAALGALAKKRKLDSARWTLARADEASARKFAAVLGVRYRRLANGDFSHTSEWILLDADGRILGRTDQLGTVPDPKFLAAVRAALDQPPNTHR